MSDNYESRKFERITVFFVERLKYSNTVGIFLVVMLILGVCSYQTTFGQSRKNQNNPRFPERENLIHKKSSESSEQKNPEYYYFPQTMQEVARTREKYLKNNGNFNYLISKQPVRKTTSNEWDNVGPFGSSPECGTNASTNHYSGRIISLAQDWDSTNVMYLGAASGGLWKSVNKGQSWKNIIDTLPCPSVSYIETNRAKPGEVWIGTGNVDGEGYGVSIGIVYYSSNYGTTWQEVHFALSDIKWVSKILIRPGASTTQPDVIFIATDKGIYRSEDKVHWTKVLSGAFSDIVTVGYFLSTDYNVIAAQIRDTHDSSPIWYNNNKGYTGSWTKRQLPKAGTNLGRISLTSSAFGYSNKVYANVATTSNGLDGIWRSDNSGDTWTKVGNPNPGAKQMNYNNTILMDPYDTDGNTVYTGENTRELYFTTDGGNTWESSASYTDGAIHEDQHFILHDVSEVATIYVANDGGVYKSTNGGKGFVSLGNNFLPIAQIYHLTVSPEAGGLFDGSRYYIGTQDNGIQRGPNEFLHFQHLTCCDGGDIAFKDGIQYSTLVGLDNSNPNRIQHPHDGNACQAWDGFTDGLPSGTPWGSQLINNGTNFYLSFNGGVYKTTNGDLPWSLIQNFRGITSIGVDRENILVVGFNDPIPIRISNSTNTAFSSPSNPSTFWQNKKVTDIDFGPARGTHRDIYAALSGIYGIRLVKSTDDGQTFTDITGDLPEGINARSLLVDPTNDNDIYIGSDFGVYVSFNGGTNWHNYSENLPSVSYVNDLKYDPYSNKIVAATYGRGVFIADRATFTTDITSTVDKPAKFKLYRNYPNPFNPTTEIKYDIAKTGVVRLAIYNILGQKVRVLVNGLQSAGEHRVQFNASMLSSGVYIYRLEEIGHVQTRKMILLK